MKSVLSAAGTQIDVIETDRVATMAPQTTKSLCGAVDKISTQPLRHKIA